MKRSHLSQVGASSRDLSLPPLETLGAHRSQGPVDGLELMSVRRSMIEKMLRWELPLSLSGL